MNERLMGKVVTYFYCSSLTFAFFLSCLLAFSATSNLTGIPLSFSIDDTEPGSEEDSDSDAELPSPNVPVQQRGVVSVLTLLSVFSGLCVLTFRLRFVVCCKTRVMLSNSTYIRTDLFYFTLFSVVAFTLFFFFALRTGRNK